MKQAKGLKAKLDKLFSEYVRRKDADIYGIVSCFTCGVRKHWKEIDAGHFQSRRFLGTRWEEDNAKPQCKGCNMTGEQYVFGQRLGEPVADDMVRKAHVVTKMTKVDYEARIEYFKTKLKEL